MYITIPTFPLSDILSEITYIYTKKKKKKEKNSYARGDRRYLIDGDRCEISAEPGDRDLDQRECIVASGNSGNL